LENKVTIKNIVCQDLLAFTKIARDFLQLSLRYIVNGNRKIHRVVLSGKCDISQRFSQLKGDAEQCLVNLTDNLAPPPRRLTEKAGRLPGCRVRNKAHAAHLVSDVGLVAHAVGKARAAHLVSDVDLVAHLVTDTGLVV